MATQAGDEDNPSRPLLEESENLRHDQAKPRYPQHHRQRLWTREILISRKKHYFVMGLVALDVMGILADIFVSLISCDMGEKDEPWVTGTQEGLQIAGLVFSSLFLLELLLCFWAFGFEYFSSWFHIFDGVIILASFIVDLLTRGIVEEIASLVIILRLWRFVKIVEELSVGASERMEEITLKLETLEEENEQLKSEVKRYKPGDEEQARD